MSAKRGADHISHHNDVSSKKKEQPSANGVPPSCQMNPKYAVGENVLKNVVETIENPFKCYILPNFIYGDGFLEQLKKFLDVEMDYSPKRNDLYNFRQSDDLKVCRDPHVVALRRCLLDEARVMLTNLTGIQLYEDVIDITASKYEHNDVLLCHDDQLEERRVAFILYLTPSWTEADGGSLSLFDHDENGQPAEVVRQILPCWNTFVCFEVSPFSFHQVSEVLSETKCRLSVNGWFRGPKILDIPAPFVELPDYRKCGDSNVEQELFMSWINPMYLDPVTQADVQDQFCETSEISLSDFLNKDKYQEVAHALKNTDLKWLNVLPPNRGKYDTLPPDAQPDIVKQLIAIFSSEAMFLTLSNLTGLKLHPLAAVDDPSENKDDESMAQSTEAKCRLQLRRWCRGGYTLIHDHDPDVLDERLKLDVMITFNHDFEVDQDAGGFVTYIVKDSDQELLTVEPSSNTLAVVYRESETVRFTKYINHLHAGTYHDLELIFIQ